MTDCDQQPANDAQVMAKAHLFRRPLLLRPFTTVPKNEKVCGEDFPSRRKLFQHIEASGHSADHLASKVASSAEILGKKGFVF